MAIIEMTIITSIKVNACRAVAKSEGILSKGVTFEACKGSGQFKPSGKPKNVAEVSSLRTAALKPLPLCAATCREGHTSGGGSQASATFRSSPQSPNCQQPQKASK